jgi:hypothetical protein
MEKKIISNFNKELFLKKIKIIRFVKFFKKNLTLGYGNPN